MGPELLNFHTLFLSMFCFDSNDHCPSHRRLPWRPSTRQQSKTHAVFSITIHDLSLAAAHTLNPRMKMIWLKFHPVAQWETLHCHPHVSRLYYNYYGSTGYYYYMKTTQTEDIKGCRGQTLKLVPPLTIWGIILSNILQPPECSPKVWGRSDSGHMTKFQHIYVSMFLCLFMSVFVIEFVELCCSIALPVWYGFVYMLLFTVRLPPLPSSA